MKTKVQILAEMVQTSQDAASSVIGALEESLHENRLMQFAELARDTGVEVPEQLNTEYTQAVQAAYRKELGELFGGCFVATRDLSKSIALKRASGITADLSREEIEKIGDQLLINTYATWDDFEDDLYVGLEEPMIVSSLPQLEQLQELTGYVPAASQELIDKKLQVLLDDTNPLSIQLYREVKRVTVRD